MPVVGGLGVIAMGFKDILDGAEGIRLSPGDISFMRASLVDIAALTREVLAKAGEMEAIPELAAMAARWKATAAALASVEKDLRALLAEKAKPSSSPRAETLTAWSAPDRARPAAAACPTRGH